jgi:hypothetical protein
LTVPGGWLAVYQFGELVPPMTPSGNETWAGITPLGLSRSVDMAAATQASAISVYSSATAELP